MNNEEKKQNKELKAINQLYDLPISIEEATEYKKRMVDFYSLLIQMDKKPNDRHNSPNS